MAEKISIQIALEGGAEVQRQLAGIGEAGQKAFADIAKSAEQAGGFKKLNTEEVTAGLKAAGVAGKEFGQILKAVQTATKFETLVSGVQSVENAFVALGRAAGPVGLAIAAGMQAAAKATIAFADTISKASDEAVKLGLSFNEFQQRLKDFEKFGAIGKTAAEGLEAFTKAMQKTIDQADPGSNLKLFGNAVELARSRMPGFLEQLRRMPDGLERTNLAIENFGRVAGTAIIQELRRAEGSMTSAEAKAYDLNQAIERLSARWAAFGSVQFAPALTAGIDAVAAAVDALNQRMQTNPFMAWIQVATFLIPPIYHAIQLIIRGVSSLAASVGGDFWNLFSQSAVTSFNQVISAVQGAGSAIADFVSSLTGITWDTISSGATAAWQAVTTSIQGAGNALTDFVSSIGSITWDAISSAGVAAWNAITGAIQAAIDKLLQFIGLKPQAPATGGDAAGKARGGLIGGRGSGTSDSNLAWLSRGEHVMPASVVRRPGMLAFLEAVRRGGGIPGYADGGRVITGGQPSGGGGLSGQMADWIFTIASAINEMRRALTAVAQQIEMIGQQFTDKVFPVIDAMNQTANDLSRKGFAHGGLLGGRGTGTSDSNLAWLSRGEYIMPARIVARPGMLDFLEMLRSGLMPRFATGGAVGGMSPVTINFPGTPPISGLRASASVVEQLQRAAALAQVRSGGRKPSRYS